MNMKFFLHSLIILFTLNAKAMHRQPQRGGAQSIDIGLTEEQVENWKEYESSLQQQKIQDPIVAFALLVNPQITSRDDIDEQELLYEAIGTQHEDINMVELLLKRNVNPNHEKSNGTTPLLQAVTSGNIPAAKLLLTYGADVNHKTKNRSSALQKAQAMKNNSFIKLLKQHGAHQ